MGVEEAMTESGGKTLIRVEVVPGSKRAELRYDPWRKAVVVKVTAPPKGGKANAELLELFESIFGDAEIVKGNRSRSKVVAVSCGLEEVLGRLSDILKRERWR